MKQPNFEENVFATQTRIKQPITLLFSSKPFI